jgi:histidine ammonia-lyase
MIAHYTQAAMVAANRRLAAPAGVDSIPTSAMQEDHVSMAWAAARKLRQSLDNLRRVLTVELTIAARALDLRAPLASAAGTGAARKALRAAVPRPGGGDRWLSPELAAAEKLVADGAVITAVQAAIGALE